MKRINQLAFSSVFILFNSLSFATNGFHLEAYGPVSKAMGGAGVADDIGNYALMYNPATLNLMPTDQRIELGLDIINGDVGVISSTRGATEGKTGSNNRNPYIGPVFSYAQRMDKTVWGGGLFVEGGIGTEYGTDSFYSLTPAGYDTNKNISSRLLVLRAPIGMSVEVSDKLVIGGSFDFLWNGWNMDVLLGVDQIASLAAMNRISGQAFSPMAGLLGNSGAAYLSSSRNNFLASGFDAYGWGGKFGFTYQLAENTKMGFVYSLKSRFQDTQGRVNSSIYGSGLTPGQPVNFTGTLKLDNFQMPAWFALGFNHAFSEQFKMNLDIRHIQYKDTMKDLDFKINLDGVGSLNLLIPQNWDDITIVSIGSAYQFNKDVILRLGASFANNPVNNNSMLHTLPAISKTHLMSGLTYQLSKKSSLDFAFSWALKNNATNNSTPFNGSNSVNPEVTAEIAEYNFQIGYSWNY